MPQKLAHNKHQALSPQLGKTGSIDLETSLPKEQIATCSNQVLLSEQKISITTTQNEIPFRINAMQECSHHTQVLIPCTKTKTLEMQVDEQGKLMISLGAKNYLFEHISEQNTYVQETNRTLESDAHKDWKTSFQEESSAEDLQLSQTLTHGESGFA